MNLKIICDTNIWYNIGEGNLDPESLKGHCLIATYYTFSELNSTPKALSDYGKVQRAAKAITTYSCDQILENAILHLARLINPYVEDRKYYYNAGIREWNEIRLLANLPKGFNPSDAIKKLYEENVVTRQAGSIAAANVINDILEDVRRQSHTLWKQNKSKYFKSSLKGIIRLLNDILEEYSEGKVQLTKDFEIKRIELFITVFVFYFKKLEIGKMVSKPNDAVDLFNMVYVRPGMKYFTKDKRWIDLIREAGLEAYLFTQ